MACGFSKGLRVFGVPLKWSALRYTLREIKTDITLTSRLGREKFRARMLADGSEWASVNLLRQVMHLPGDVIECGVYRGHSLIRLALAMRESGHAKALIGLDSFDGFPAGSVRDVDVVRGRNKTRLSRKFQLADKVPVRLQRIADLYGQDLRLYPGYFHETLPQLRDQRFCFVHLDCDLYESYWTCLEALYECVVPGGLIVFDEYKIHDWPGATRAVDEFFGDKPEEIERYSTPVHSSFSTRYFVRKIGRSDPALDRSAADAA